MHVGEGLGCQGKQGSFEKTSFLFTAPWISHYLLAGFNCAAKNMLCLFFWIDVKKAFEIVDREQAKAIFTCKTEEDKNEWMAGLMTIYMRR